MKEGEGEGKLKRSLSQMVGGWECAVVGSVWVEFPTQERSTTNPSHGLKADFSIREVCLQVIEQLTSRVAVSLTI